MYGNQQIVQVNGENGARAFAMMPNSSALLLDTTDSLVWLCQTDGAGYKTVTPFKIEKYVPPEQVQYNDIISRIDRLEAILNESNNRKHEGEQESQCDISANDEH